MPVLKNAKHELFAQGIAKGLAASQAYKSAGYTASGNAADACASRLLTDAKVQARVADLQSRVVTDILLTREWVIEQLIDNVRQAKGGDKLDGPTANKALELLGKELGMFIERKEVGKPGEFDNMTVEQKRERVFGIAKQLGLDRIGPTAGSA